jgi:phage shock protein PspC (stress-responsive transcriptional regulator)
MKKFFLAPDYDIDLQIVRLSFVCKTVIPLLQIAFINYSLFVIICLKRVSEIKKMGSVDSLGVVNGCLFLGGKFFNQFGSQLIRSLPSNKNKSLEIES